MQSASLKQGITIEMFAGCLFISVQSVSFIQHKVKVKEQSTTDYLVDKFTHRSGQISKAQAVLSFILQPFTINELQQYSLIGG